MDILISQNFILSTKDSLQINDIPKWLKSMISKKDGEIILISKKVDLRHKEVTGTKKSIT